MDSCESLFKTFSFTDNSHWSTDPLRPIPEKSNSEATEFKNKGNVLYKNKNFLKCMALYTKSLRFAEYNSEEYGIALANRSAVTLMLRKYLYCLNDIELCLRTKYPQKLRLKLHVRKAACLFHLQRYKTLAKYLKEISGMYDIEEIGDKLSPYRNFNSDFKFRTLEITMPVVSNTKFHSASNKIDIQYNDRRGRHVVANRDIKAGEVLFVDEAYVLGFGTSDFEYTENKCYNCLEDCPCSIPCKTCTIFIYCDESCRDESWTEFHRFECAGIALWYGCSTNLLALRCIIKGARAAFPKPSSDPSDCCDDFGNGYEYFAGLHCNLERTVRFPYYIEVAHRLLAYLRTETDFFEHFNIPSSSYTFVGGALLKSIAIIKDNTFPIWHSITTVDICKNSITDKHDLDIVPGKEKPVKVATVIFLSLSMLNHACKANVSIYYVKNTAIVKAIEDIKCGNEICISYDVDYRRYPKAMRLERIFDLYGFVCICHICLSGKDTKFRELAGQICPRCPSMTVKQHLRDPCKTCNSTTPAWKYLEIEERYDRICQKDSATVFELERCVKRFERLLTPMHIYLEVLSRRLYEKYGSLGNKTETLKWYKRYLDIVKERYGRISTHYIITLDSHLHDCLPDCPDKLEKKLLLHYYFPTNEYTLV